MTKLIVFIWIISSTFPSAPTTPSWVRTDPLPKWDSWFCQQGFCVASGRVGGYLAKRTACSTRKCPGQTGRLGFAGRRGSAGRFLQWNKTEISSFPFKSCKNQGWKNAEDFCFWEIYLIKTRASTLFQATTTIRKKFVNKMESIFKPFTTISCQTGKKSKVKMWVILKRFRADLTWNNWLHHCLGVVPESGQQRGQPALRALAVGVEEDEGVPCGVLAAEVLRPNQSVSRGSPNHPHFALVVRVHVPF